MNQHGLLFPHLLSEIQNPLPQRIVQGRDPAPLLITVLLHILARLLRRGAAFDPRLRARLKRS